MCCIASSHEFFLLVSFFLHLYEIISGYSGLPFRAEWRYGMVEWIRVYVCSTVV
jgi:hypothetical protein